MSSLTLRTCGKEFGLAAENEIVIFRKILEEEPEFPQVLHLHEVSVVDDGDEHFSLTVQGESLFDKSLLTLETVACEFDVQGLAKNFSVLL